MDRSKPNTIAVLQRLGENSSASNNLHERSLTSLSESTAISSYTFNSKLTDICDDTTVIHISFWGFSQTMRSDERLCKQLAILRWERKGEQEMMAAL